jgi:hypothetical protein
MGGIVNGEEFIADREGRIRTHVAFGVRDLWFVVGGRSHCILPHFDGGASDELESVDLTFKRCVNT